MAIWWTFDAGDDLFPRQAFVGDSFFENLMEET